MLRATRVACSRAQDQAQRTNNIESKVDRVFHPYEDCTKKEGEKSTLWLLNVKS